MQAEKTGAEIKSAAIVVHVFVMSSSMRAWRFKDSLRATRLDLTSYGDDSRDPRPGKLTWSSSDNRDEYDPSGVFPRLYEKFHR